MERDRQHIEDMILSARMVGTYLEGVTQAGFLKDVKLQDAVIRRLEVIGEAAGRVSWWSGLSRPLLETAGSCQPHNRWCAWVNTSAWGPAEAMATHSRTRPSEG